MANLKTIIKAFKLLSNPRVVDRLYKELASEAPRVTLESPKLGSADIYHNKYYMVQVVH